jgi:hypothetical protein
VDEEPPYNTRYARKPLQTWFIQQEQETTYPNSSDIEKPEINKEKNHIIIHH